MTIEATKPMDPEAQKLVEAEYGPCVFLDHPDGSRFGFKLLTREEFTTRRNRVKRGDAEADDRMLQERCVWPSRDAWNKYVAECVLEPSAYAAAYREVNGGRTVRQADPDEVPADGTAAKYLSNSEKVFGFRKPGRAETKMFQAQLMAEQRGEKLPADPLETLLRSCATDNDFGAWLDAHLFGIGAFGEEFLTAFGMGEVRVSGK